MHPEEELQQSSLDTVQNCLYKTVATPASNVWIVNSLPTYPFPISWDQGASNLSFYMQMYMLIM